MMIESAPSVAGERAEPDTEMAAPADPIDVVWRRLLASAEPLRLDIPVLLRRRPASATTVGQQPERLRLDVLDEQRRSLGRASVYPGGWRPGQERSAISHYYPVLASAFRGLEARGEEPIIRVQLLQAVNAEAVLGRETPHIVLLRFILGPEAAIPGSRVEAVYQCPLSGLMRHFVGVGLDALRDPATPAFVSGQAIHRGYARAARAYQETGSDEAATAAYLDGVRDTWVELFPYLLLDRPSSRAGKPTQLYRHPVEALSAVLGRCRQLYQEREAGFRLLQERLFFSPTRGISGRADRIIEDSAGRELWELKMKGGAWAVDRSPKTGQSAPGGIQALAYHEILRTIDGRAPQTFVELLDADGIEGLRLDEHPVTRRAEADIALADDRYLDLLAQTRNVAYLLESGLFSGYNRETLAMASRQGARLSVLGGDYDLFGQSAPCSFCPAGMRDVCESASGGGAAVWPAFFRHIPERLYQYWAWFHRQLKQAERQEVERLHHLVKSSVALLENGEGITIAGLTLTDREGRLVTLSRNARIETRIREDDRVLITPCGTSPGEVESVEGLVRSVGARSLQLEVFESLTSEQTYRVDQLGFWERSDWQIEGLTDFLIRSMQEAGPSARRLDLSDLPPLTRAILGEPACPETHTTALTPTGDRGEGISPPGGLSAGILHERSQAEGRNSDGGHQQASSLNSGQQRALDAALALRPGDLLLIQGPPGTGKTSLIAELTRQLVVRDFWQEAERRRPALILANTNRACNEVILKLHQRFPDLRPYLVRLGTAGAGMETEVREHIIGERLRVGERLNAVDLATDGPTTLAGLVRQGCALLEEGLVFVGTLASASRPEMRGIAFSTIIVDETGQATEPAVLQALRHAARGYETRLILVGDHCQLPPVVPDDLPVPTLLPEIEGIGLDPLRGPRQSLFERLASRSPGLVHTLSDQYRMCAPISELVSQAFYDGRLRPGAPSVAEQRLGQLLERVGGTLPDEPFARAAFASGEPIVLVDTSQDRAATETVTLQARNESRDNPREAVIIAELVAALLGPLEPDARDAVAAEIGIISPYRRQNNRIRQELVERLGPAADLIRVDTVDRFQGGERDIILLSLVASNMAASIGALHADWRRMNVAISRARCKVVIVGNRRTFERPSTPDEEEAKRRYRRLFALIDGDVSRGVACILEPPQ